MRILHISKKLPDVRVEKCIIGDKKEGHSVAFAGYSNAPPTFDELKDTKQYLYRFGHAQTFGFKKNESISDLKDAIDDFDPDFLHVHDIYFAILAMELDRPWIYNDHEGWSNQISWLVSGKPKWTPKYWFRSSGIALRRKIIRLWEPRILKDRVTITVSEKIADLLHRRWTKKTFVIPNFPMISELPKSIPNEKKNCLAYVGRDLLEAAPYHRDTRGFVSMVKKNKINLLVVGDKNLKSEGTIQSLGYKDHKDIMNLIAECRFGVVPFKSYRGKRIHIGDHNKISLYAHAGQIVIGPRTLDSNPHVKYILKFDSFNEIPELMKNAQNIDPEIIKNYARKKMVWDNYFDVQKKANIVLIESIS